MLHTICTSQLSWVHWVFTLIYIFTTSLLPPSNAYVEQCWQKTGEVSLARPDSRVLLVFHWVVVSGSMYLFNTYWAAVPSNLRQVGHVTPPTSDANNWPVIGITRWVIRVTHSRKSKAQFLKPRQWGKWLHKNNTVVTEFWQKEMH